MQLLDSINVNPLCHLGCVYLCVSKRSGVILFLKEQLNSVCVCVLQDQHSAQKMRQD